MQNKTEKLRHKAETSVVCLSDSRTVHDTLNVY